MPTTSYTDSTFSVAAIGNRTDAAGGAVTDVTAEEVRLVAQIVSEGYLAPSAAFKVQATETASMSVTVGSGTAKADHYVVSGDVGGQGNYIVRLDTAAQTVALNAADASQSRTDEIYLVVQDNAYDASSRGLPRIAYRKGDLGGALPGPDTAWKAAVLLARIAVAATSTTVEDEDITDLRSAAGWKPAGDLDVNLGNQLNVGGSPSAASLAVLTPAFWAETLSTRQVGDANNRFAIHADGFLDWGGGSGAVDVNLFRASAGTLRTDDHLQVGGNASVDSLTVAGDASVGDDVTLAAGSVLTWAGDTTLYRVLANILKTDDSLAIGGTELFLDDAAAGITFGGGGSTTRLHRTTTTQIKCDSDFFVEDGLFVDGGIGGKGIGVGQQKVATTDTVRTNSTAWGDSPLTAFLEAGATYILEMFANVFTTSATVEIGLSIPAGTGGSWGVDDVTGVGTPRIVGPQSSARSVLINGSLFTAGTAGPLVVRMRQFSADPVSSTLRAHSWLKVTRTA